MHNEKRDVAIAYKIQSYTSYETQCFVPFPFKAGNYILS